MSHILLFCWRKNRSIIFNLPCNKTAALVIERRGFREEISWKQINDNVISQKERNVTQHYHGEKISRSSAFDPKNANSGQFGTFFFWCVCYCALREHLKLSKLNMQTDIYKLISFVYEPKCFFLFVCFSALMLLAIKRGEKKANCFSNSHSILFRFLGQGLKISVGKALQKYCCIF